MSDLTPEQIGEWIKTLYVNIPDVEQVNQFREEILRRRLYGSDFDDLLHSNTLPEEMAEVWPSMSPTTAVLIRKLWHTDFYPETLTSPRRCHVLKRPMKPRALQISVDEVANVVNSIVDVVTPTCSLDREHIIEKVSSVIPLEVEARLGKRIERRSFKNL